MRRRTAVAVTAAALAVAGFIVAAVVGFPHGTPTRDSDGSDDGSAVPYATTAAAQIYECLIPYRFADARVRDYSGSQLLQLYRYDRTVLWPCLAAMGVHVGKPPTRKDFTDSLRASVVNPFRGAAIGSRELPRLVRAAGRCPMQPGYLVAQASRSAG